MKKKRPQARFTITYTFTPKIVAREILDLGIELPKNANTSRKIQNKIKAVTKNSTINLDETFADATNKIIIGCIASMVFDKKKEPNATTGSFDL